MQKISEYVEIDKEYVKTQHLSEIKKKFFTMYEYKL